MKYALAIDIGASSGRHIVGWMGGGEIRTREVYRFPNGVESAGGHLVWNMDALTAHVRRGIEEAKAQFGNIRSLSVDTWGVDYVLLKGEEEILPCFGLIGQKALVKTAVIVDISRVTAVLSCFREDTGWTKRVGKNVGNRRFIRGK